MIPVNFPKNLTTAEYETMYTKALQDSRNIFKTSSPTKALCLSLGIIKPSKAEIQSVRLFLYEKGVQLKVGDKQCVDPITKEKKSKKQAEVRKNINIELPRLQKIKNKLTNKSKEEKELIKEKQIKTLANTIQIKMSDEIEWNNFQKKCQEKSKQSKLAMTADQKTTAISNWKKVYWLKSENERNQIQEKREKGSKFGFWDNGVWFSSTYEFNMFWFLTKHNENFTYHNLKCDLGGYTWSPDFYLPDKNIIIETKGKYPKSENYWISKTLPKIKEANLSAKYIIKVCWDRSLKKYSSVDDLLDMCENII